MRVLLMAYACEPGSGSEPGTGWNLAMELSRQLDVTVITRANNRDAIEADPERLTREGLRFVYHDLSRTALRLKKWKVLNTQAYYALWHWTLSRRIQRDASLQNFDVVQHLTFNSFEIVPSALIYAGKTRIWGPIGGGQTAPASLLPTVLMADRIREGLRTKRVRRSANSAAVKKMLEACDLVLFANEETRALLKPVGRSKTEMMIDVGVSPECFFPAEKPGDGTRILYAGRVESRKGIGFLLEAFRHALKERPELRLRVVGSGPYLEVMRDRSKKMGMGQQVKFIGKVDHVQMAKELRQADVFVFPSLRDTSGAIVLEAMASGVPVVCLDHQGGRLMTGEGSGLRVPVTNLQETAQNFGKAVVKLSLDVEERRRCGSVGRSRVIEQFCWEKKAERLIGLYGELAAKREFPHKNST